MSVLDRARSYLAALPPAVSGQGGHAALWTAALALVRGFNLEEDAALNLLRGDFNRRCSPPWSDRELLHKVSGAAGADTPAGYLLDAVDLDRGELRAALDARARFVDGRLEELADDVARLADAWEHRE